MADETNTVLAAEVAETASPATTPTIKKQRAPRRQKTAGEPLQSPSKATTRSAAVAPGKRGKQVIAGKSKPIERHAGDDMVAAKDAAKTAGRNKTVKPLVQAASASAHDEMADLIQLEEENKRLRNSLAEKLRAENADLRRRLGLN